MTAFATKNDYELRFGAVPEEDGGRIETLLEDVTALIKEAVAGSTAGWVTDPGDQPPPRGVVYVCISAVRRSLQHGDGVLREQLGEHAVTYRAGSSALWLTKHERRVVRKAAGLSAPLSIELETPYSGGAATSELDFSLPLEEEGS